MKLKRGTEENLEALVLISQRWAAEMGYDVEDEEIRKDMKRMMDKGVVYFVAHKDKVLGMMSGLAYEIFWTKERVAEEHWFFVDPEFQKKGIGKILEFAFRNWAKIRNCDSVMITPNRYGSTDPAGVSKYLAKQGYTIHGYRMKRSLKDVYTGNNSNH